MKFKSTLLILLLMSCSWVIAQDHKAETITAEYGPPAEANVWTQYTIPLTAETFGVDESTLDLVLANVNSFWIRTEMHTGDDIGGIDDVFVGTTYFSDFNTSSEGWSSGGDGTMEWMNAGGYEGGFLQISDWAIGDWHWLISPASWAGDWSAFKGEDITFWYKTDRPSYSAIVKITTETQDRLVINTVVSNTILPDDSVRVELEIFPPPLESIAVNITSSDNSCITVPSQVTVPAGVSTVEFYISAASGASVGCQSVIEATYANFITSRVTMQVLDDYGVEENDISQYIDIFPNPCHSSLKLSNTSGAAIEQLKLVNLCGNTVMELQQGVPDKIEIDMSDKPAGIYFLQIFIGNRVFTSKVIVK